MLQQTAFYRAQRAPLHSVVLGKARRKPRLSPLTLTPAIDRLEQEIARGFTAMVEAVQEQVSGNALIQALQRKDTKAVLDVLAVEEHMLAAGISGKKGSFRDAWYKMFLLGAQDEVNRLRKVPVQKQSLSIEKAMVGQVLAFDVRLPEAEQFIDGCTFNLIREVSLETREGVKVVLAEAFRVGGHPFAQAREIKQFIGLTQKQAQAVLNFRRMLESGDAARMRVALERAIRDKRFDSTVLRAIREGATLSQDRIDTMVERYYARMLQYRARMIARTETKRALNRGRREAWLQAQEQGLLRRGKARRKWILAPLACPICQSIALANSDGVAIDEPFEGGEPGEVHPHCTCDQGIVLV